jgi:hypothetical protein
MKCFTLDKGIISAGIRLWQDGPNKCFVHIRPDVWMPVSAELLNSTAPDHIERLPDGQIVLHRASTQVIANHVVEFIPETEQSSSRACVLGHFGLDVAHFNEAAPEPTVPYRTVLGLNVCSGQVMGARRITHDRIGEGAQLLAHEEYSFVVGMDAGDDVRVHVIFYPAGDSLPSGQMDPWVDGTFLRFDGKNVSYNQIEARTQAERFSAARRRPVPLKAVA